MSDCFDSSHLPMRHPPSSCKVSIGLSTACAGAATCPRSTSCSWSPCPPSSGSASHWQTGSYARQRREMGFESSLSFIDSAIVGFAVVDFVVVGSAVVAAAG